MPKTIRYKRNPTCPATVKIMKASAPPISRRYSLERLSRSVARVVSQLSSSLSKLVNNLSASLMIYSRCSILSRRLSTRMILPSAPANLKKTEGLRMQNRTALDQSSTKLSVDTGRTAQLPSHRSLNLKSGTTRLCTKSRS